MNKWTPDIYAKAWDFSSRQHNGQTYGGKVEGEKVEYINHVASVAMEVIWALQFNATANAALAVQCALLHDTLEDTSASYDLLKAEFGQAVADGVQALSKNTALPDKTAQMRDSLDRILLQPQEIWMVKMADRISNLYHPPHYWGNEKILAYRHEAQMIHDELHTADAKLAERLQAKIQAYPQFLRK
ncbi:bifunctional (p)ppGpp synthetase/guanosine-3',5'-bis(diphosphate) 3'-pyrophosphohydrolase [Undibacterium sp. CY18W]|uniref:Bifunctional (P)ppGpp synthetase/guanosine-3',5'-bis(Diphosphate) 3'-pyrophosphohydrolase n=1 Tax=Undibacterium hunanense TaxID=2762292 RepID=A0ABR6ZP21_9BURK|nr:HD domain-containing protein [Undibacterium hunanense]MBC3917631.1 bifunctional (p)ppGpp synthetase/guanosine-3',5'-bis(diphosphate) 3'-pyrophosphohydrolase [Undibacterium hunanense]